MEQEIKDSPEVIEGEPHLIGWDGDHTLLFDDGSKIKLPARVVIEDRPDQLLQTPLELRLWRGIIIGVRTKKGRRAVYIFTGDRYGTNKCHIQTVLKTMRNLLRWERAT